jgi:iron complex outermembrane recepter protein
MAKTHPNTDYRIPALWVRSSAFALALSVLFGVGDARAEAARNQAESLDDILSTVVVSVSKRPQKIADTPAAIFVITQEDIRRSGMTSIPELLRMVPGAGVGQPTAKSFNVGIRGDESQFARGLLILVDGRAAYTTAFNGTFWDEVDMPLEDIDHIEVIRGPGGSVWGANAVHGVINIIRKAPEDTQGTFVSAAHGNEARLLTSFRTGGTTGNAAYRFSGRYVNRDSFRDRADTKEQHDGYRNGVSSFRMDLRPQQGDLFTMQGDFYTGDRNAQTRRDLNPAMGTFLQSFETNPVRGGNGLMRFERQHSETSVSEVQMYLDYRFRDIAIVEDKRMIADVEFRNRFQWGDRQTVNWGFGTRHIKERLDGSLNFIVEPDKQDEAIHNVFVQDEIKLADKLIATIGSKFEYNTYTGWEVQPTARLLFRFSDEQQAWAAVSRAVRIPSRGVNTGEYQIIPAYIGPTPFKFMGIGEDFDAEILIETELGYRIQPRPSLYFDLVGFVNRMQNWEGARGLPPTIGNISLTQQLDDFSERSAVGAEATLRWNPMDFWKLAFTWSHIHISSSQPDVFSFSGEDSSPPHILTAQSYLDLPGDFELDFGVYYHGRKGNNFNAVLGDKLNSYTRHDVRLAWRPSDRFEVSLVGQNLLDRLHREGADFFEGSMLATGQPQSSVERSVYAKVSWSF